MALSFLALLLPQALKNCSPCSDRACVSAPGTGLCGMSILCQVNATLVAQLRKPKRRGFQGPLNGQEAPDL